MDFVHHEGTQQEVVPGESGHDELIHHEDCLEVTPFPPGAQTQVSAWEPVVCHMDTLPWELVLYIVDYLDHVSATCLMLTCRGNYDFLRRKKLKPTGRLARIELLRLLERDHPDLVHCRMCLALVRWDKSWKPGSPNRELTSCQPIKGDRNLLKPSVFDSHNRSSGGNFRPWLHSWGQTPPFPGGLKKWDEELRLPFALVYLVMRCHFQGPDYGFPLSRLHWNDEYPRTRQGLGESFASELKVSRSQSARIINDELYLRREVRKMAEPRIFRGKLARGQLTFGPVCEHHRKEWEEWDIPDPLQNNLGFNVYQNMGRSCSKCRTDYCLSAHPQERSKEWTYGLTVFVNLGACQAPQEFGWSSWAPHHGWAEEMLSAEARFESRVSRHGHADLGSVKRRWVEAAGNKEEVGHFQGFAGSPTRVVPDWW